MDTTDKRFQNILPVSTILLMVVVHWYAGTVWLKATGAIERVITPRLEAGATYTWLNLIEATMGMQRPVLPSPHQVVTSDFVQRTERLVHHQQFGLKRQRHTASRPDTFSSVVETRS